MTSGFSSPPVPVAKTCSLAKLPPVKAGTFGPPMWDYKPPQGFIHSGFGPQKTLPAAVGQNVLKSSRSSRCCPPGRVCRQESPTVPPKSGPSAAADVRLLYIGAGHRPRRQSCMDHGPGQTACLSAPACSPAGTRRPWVGSGHTGPGHCSGPVWP